MCFMYINDNTDRFFLKRLLESKIADEERMKKGDLDDGCHFGLFFDSLFDDINETLFFSLNSDGIRVFIDPKSMKEWGPVGSKEMVNGLYSERNKMKVEIIERIQLLRQLEEHRLAVWNYDGRDNRNYKHSSTAHIFSFGGNENAEYIRKHINETIVPTKHLKDLINNDFLDSDEQRNRKLLRNSTITTRVAIIALVVSVFSMFFSIYINTLKRNERNLIIEKSEITHYPSKHIIQQQNDPLHHQAGQKMIEMNHITAGQTREWPK